MIFFGIFPRALPSPNTHYQKWVTVVKPKASTTLESSPFYKIVNPKA